jgi:hypothetical protein
MAATYLKGSFLRAVCNYLRANIPPSLPLPQFYVLMINPLKKRKRCRKEKTQKDFKINVNLLASHLFPFSR